MTGIKLYFSSCAFTNYHVYLGVGGRVFISHWSAFHCVLYSEFLTWSLMSSECACTRARSSSHMFNNTRSALNCIALNCIKFPHTLSSVVTVSMCFEILPICSSLAFIIRSKHCTEFPSFDNSSVYPRRAISASESTAMHASVLGQRVWVNTTWLRSESPTNRKKHG